MEAYFRITRDSVIRLCKDWGYEVQERLISIDEVYDVHQKGLLEEFRDRYGSSYISCRSSPLGNHVMQINDGGIGKLSQKLYDNLTGIQLGDVRISMIGQ